MILLAHPFGNASVRALLKAFEGAGLLDRYVTTLGWSNENKIASLLPAAVRRRGYDLPAARIEPHPTREMVRLLSGRGGASPLTEHERGWASVDRVLQKYDALAAQSLRKRPNRISAVYAFEDGAEQLFRTARELGLRRVYDLQIAYWETSQRLLHEEAKRYPAWEPTLGATRDSEAKLARKTRELELAEMVMCPSAFVLESLPSSARETKRCLVVPFASPPTPQGFAKTPRRSGRLRLLFAGALTQRKGLADLFAAMKLVDSSEVELVVMGSLLQPLSWYRQQFADFTYEPPRPHAEVLRLMQSCDVFVLPSIVEGRAFVQQEAMACGLPLIATKNAGADDMITDGETGFLVPIRSPEAIAEKICWCLAHPESIAGMGIAAQGRAAELTWPGYGEKVLAAIRTLTGE